MREPSQCEGARMMAMLLGARGLAQGLKLRGRGGEPFCSLGTMGSEILASKPMHRSTLVIHVTSPLRTKV